MYVVDREATRQCFVSHVPALCTYLLSQINSRILSVLFRLGHFGSAVVEALYNDISHSDVWALKLLDVTCSIIVLVAKTL